MLGRRSRANRNGSGTRKGIAASANSREEDQVEPLEPLNPSCVAPWPEPPKGTVGRTSATGRFFAAFESGGGRASTRRTVTRATTRAIAARTSGLGEDVSVTRRTETARACLHRCESGTRAVGRAQTWTNSFLGIAARLVELTAVIAGSSAGSNAIVDSAGRGRKLTMSAAAATAASALVAAAEDATSGAAGASAAGASWISTITTGGGADDAGSAVGWGAVCAGAVGAAGAAGAGAASSLTTSAAAGASAVGVGAGAVVLSAAVVVLSGEVVVLSGEVVVLSGEVVVVPPVVSAAGAGAGAAAVDAGSDDAGAGAGAGSVVPDGGVVVVPVSAGGGG